MCTYNLLWTLLILFSNVHGKVCCKNYFQCDGDVMECNQQIIECSLSNQTCSINCIKGITTNPSSTCSRSHQQGGCCESVIMCPFGNDCDINCSFSCQNLIIHAENSTSLHITDCTETSCKNMTVYCPLYSSLCTINNITYVNKSIKNKKESNSSFHLFIVLMSTFLTFLCLCIFATPYYCFRMKQLKQLKRLKSHQNDVPNLSVYDSVCDSIPCQNVIETVKTVNTVETVSKNNIINAMNEDLNEDCCSKCECECNGDIEITECKIVERIINIMKTFEELSLESKMNIITSNDIVNLILKSVYNVNNIYCYNMYYLFIKNDYNHILEKHKDIESLYYIYFNIWDYKHFVCDINNCDHVIRSINYNKNKKQNKDLLILSLFDQLHSYFIHSECINNMLLETETINTYKSIYTSDYTNYNCNDNEENESLQINMPLSNKYETNNSNNSNNESELSEDITIYLSQQFSQNKQSNINTSIKK